MPDQTGWMHTTVLYDIWTGCCSCFLLDLATRRRTHVHNNAYTYKLQHSMYEIISACIVRMTRGWFPSSSPCFHAWPLPTLFLIHWNGYNLIFQKMLQVHARTCYKNGSYVFWHCCHLSNLLICSTFLNVGVLGAMVGWMEFTLLLPSSRSQCTSIAGGVKSSTSWSHRSSSSSRSWFGSSSWINIATFFTLCGILVQIISRSCSVNIYKLGIIRTSLNYVLFWM